jgi:hypothetical protein
MFSGHPALSCTQSHAKMQKYTHGVHHQVSYTQVPQKTISSAFEMGAQLKQQRLQQGISLEDISRQTFIKLHYLYALEEGHFEQLPAPVYTSGYIRQYARLLNLDETQLIRQYHEHISLNPGRIKNESGAAETLTSSSFTPVLSLQNGNTRIEEIVPQASFRTGVNQVAMQESFSTAPATVSIASADKRVVDTIDGARKEALVMRHQTEQYADNVLAHLENEIQKTLTIIRNGRNHLQKRLDSYR